MEARLDDQDALEAHRRYVSSGRLDKSLLRAPVLRSWERCHDQGANPRLPRAEQLTEAETERSLSEKKWLIGMSDYYMKMLCRAAGLDRHAAMLGDANGLVLHVLGDEQSVHGPERVPGPGALLVEALAGSNGIGTPLAEGGYTELVGPEHFIQGFHPFTCQGIPLRDGDRRVVGVLSVSVRGAQAARRLREILICAAHGIEAEFRRYRLEQSVAKVLASGTLDASLVEKLRQDILQSHTAARLRVESAAKRLAGNRLEEAAELLRLAEESSTSFRDQSELWQNLASPVASAPQTVSLNEMVRHMIRLLQTEASTSGVQLMLQSAAPATVHADPRVLARMILRTLLRSFELARAGGASIVQVVPDPELGGRVRVQVVPAPDGKTPGSQPLVLGSA